MANEVEITVKSTDKTDFKSPQQGMDKLSASAKDAGKSTDDFADSQSKASKELDSTSKSSEDTTGRMAKLSVITLGMSDAIGNAGSILSDFSSIQLDAKERSLEHAQALLDVEQAEVDAEQAAVDLRQATLDLKQAQIDGRQAAADLGQAHIDEKQAALDVAVAKRELAKAIRDTGKRSLETRQATIDLKQAEQDQKQASIDAKQAIQDKKQALTDGKQAQVDATQATLDGKQALQDEQQALFDASSATATWSTYAETAATIGADLASVVGILAVATTGLKEHTGELADRFQGAIGGGRRMRLAVRGLAGASGLGLLFDATRRTSGALGTMESIAGGASLGWSVGGPWGAAIGAGAGAVFSLGKHILGAGESSDTAQVKFSDLADTLNRTTGAATRLTRRMIAQDLEQQGVLKTANELGVSTDDLISAIAGEENAVRRVRGQLADYKRKNIDAKEAHTGLSKAVDGTVRITDDLVIGLTENRKKYKLLTDAIGQGQKHYRDEVNSQKRVQEATRGTIKDVTALQKQYKKTPREVATQLKADGIDKAIGGTKRFRERVNEILDNIRDEEVGVKLSVDQSKTLMKIAEFAPQMHLAEGGRLRGVGTGTSDSIPLWGSDGEFIVREKIARRIYPFLEALNAGQAEALQAAGPGRRMRDGGLVGVDMSTKDAIIAARNSAGSIHGYMSGISSGLSRTATAIAKQLLATGGGRPLGPDGSLSLGQAMQGMTFLRAQDGKPYGWGGVGPGSYDCSGIHNAGLNAAVGRNPYSRTYGATGNAPWAGSRPGVGRVTLGWFTGDPGHMSGNWLGTNVESSGGVGVRFGGGARSPLDSMFNGLMHYEKGTNYVPRTGPAMLHRGEAVVPAAQNGQPIVVEQHIYLDSKEIQQGLVRLKRRNGGTELGLT